MNRPRVALKRIYEPAEAGDGLRFLVDRIWPRGIAKAEAKLDDWCRDIAPSTELRHWFGHEVERWEEFRRCYEAELKENHAAVEALRAQLHGRHATLLYAAKDEEHNNAVVLHEFLQRH